MIINGDCLDEMRKMDANSIDFICTDPPYGLSFMGKDWDTNTPSQDIWKEALRICKPGSMLAAFGGSRTHHHLMLAIERAGWEIRDVIMWIYGSGFPKSHNFGKQLGGDWEGYGSALKPAYEPIILAMKPLDGTFAQNAQKWGVAGINVDASRIGIGNDKGDWPLTTRQNIKDIYGKKLSVLTDNSKGRWPANIIFDEEAAQELDRQSVIEASRFFYCAKASATERNRGCEGLGLKEAKRIGEMGPCNNAKPNGHSILFEKNNHPTVKPISLMKYIIKLLSPPGKPILLDPFCGSGSTLVAAKELGIDCIGIELSAEYCEIAKARVASAQFVSEQLELNL